MVLKKKPLEYFQWISMVQTEDSLGLGHFGSRGHYLNKPILCTKFQLSEPGGGFEEDDFFNIFTTVELQWLEH